MAVKRGLRRGMMGRRRAASGPRTIDPAIEGSGEGEAVRWLVLKRPVELDGVVGESL